MASRSALEPAQWVAALFCLASVSLAGSANFTTPLPPPPPPTLPPAPPPTLRLLTRKCCSSWEHLVFNASAGADAAECSPREGAVVRHVMRELLSAANASAPDAAHWLPHALRPALAHAARWIVEYSAGGSLPCGLADRLVLGAHETDRYRLDPNGTLVLLSPTAAGRPQPRLFAPDHYCVDSAEEFAGARGSAPVFHLCPCDAAHACVRKCCPAGAVTRAGSSLHCVASASGEAWSPFAVSAENESPDSLPNVTYEILYARPPQCPSGIEVKDPEMYPAHLLDAWLAHPRGWIYQKDAPCVVALPGGEPSVAACARPEVFAGYAEVAAWAHAVTAALLVTAVGVHLALGEGATALGCAVASHAAALALRSALLAARLVPGYAAHCTLLSLLIYFFMVSSAFWLNVIAVNMVLSFRRREASACVSGGACAAWAQQVITWGGAGALVGAIAAAWLLSTLPPWLPRPALHATRLCFHDAPLYSSKWGSLLYFIGIMGTLLAVNIGLIAYISVRNRRLDQEKTHLLNKEIYINRHSRRALRYVQLLALLAAAEVAAEAAAWAGASQAQSWSEVAADCADVLRALAVFAFCACCEQARAVVGRALDAVGDAFGRCAGAGRVSPSGAATARGGAPGAEWRYVVGGAPAPVAGSEERRHRRSRPLSERPVIELWAVGGPPAPASPESPPAHDAAPVFANGTKPTSSL